MGRSFTSGSDLWLRESTWNEAEGSGVRSHLCSRGHPEVSPAGHCGDQFFQGSQPTESSRKKRMSGERETRAFGVRLNQFSVPR